MHAVYKLATEDAENLEIAKSKRAGDQKQKYDLEWPYVDLCNRYRMVGSALWIIKPATPRP